MDFPIDLNRGAFITGIDEIKQDIYILLTETAGNFLQSPSLGAKFSVHQEDPSLLEYAIDQTLKVINGITVNLIKVELPDVVINITYKGEDIEIKLNLSDEN